MRVKHNLKSSVPLLQRGADDFNVGRLKGLLYVFLRCRNTGGVLLDQLFQLIKVPFQPLNEWLKFIFCLLARGEKANIICPSHPGLVLQRGQGVPPPAGHILQVDVALLRHKAKESNPIADDELIVIGDILECVLRIRRTHSPFFGQPRVSVAGPLQTGGHVAKRGRPHHREHNTLSDGEIPNVRIHIRRIHFLSFPCPLLSDRAIFCLRGSCDRLSPAQCEILHLSPLPSPGADAFIPGILANKLLIELPQKLE